MSLISARTTFEPWPGAQEHEIALFGLRQILGGGRAELDLVVGGHVHVDALGLDVENESAGEAAQRRLAADAAHEGCAVAVEERALLVEVRCDGGDVAARRLAMVAHIGLGDDDRGIDDGAGAVGKPGVEAAIERDGGEGRDDERGKRSDKAEQRDEADMEAGARLALALGGVEMPELPEHHRSHSRHQEAVEDQQPDNGWARRRDRCEAGQDGVGEEPG